MLARRLTKLTLRYFKAFYHRPLGLDFQKSTLSIYAIGIWYPYDTLTSAEQILFKPKTLSF